MPTSPFFLIRIRSGSSRSRKPAENCLFRNSRASSAASRLLPEPPRPDRRRILASCFPEVAQSIRELNSSSYPKCFVKRTRHDSNLNASSFSGKSKSIKSGSLAFLASPLYTEIPVFLMRMLAIAPAMFLFFTGGRARVSRMPASRDPARRCSSPSPP